MQRYNKKYELSKLAVLALATVFGVSTVASAKTADPTIELPAVLGHEDIGNHVSPLNPLNSGCNDCNGPNAISFAELICIST